MIGSTRDGATWFDRLTEETVPARRPGLSGCRLELVRAGGVGRLAPFAVAAVLLAGASVLLGVVSALAVMPVGYGVAGSWLFGAAMAMVSFVFGAVALVTAQVVEHARSATGMAALAIGAALVIRGAGDVLQAQGSWLSWLSPIAWAQQTRAFHDGRSWPLLLGVALGAVLVGVAAALQARRDLMAGLVRPRPGRTHAPSYVRGVLALFLRLERGAMLGWASATLVLGALFGALTDSVRTSLGELDNELLLDALGDPDRLVVGFLGIVLDLPQALLDLSPLSHIAAVPLETQAATPLVVLALIGAGLVAAALVRLRRRDVVVG